MTNPRGKKAAEDSYLPRSAMAFISKLFFNALQIPRCFYSTRKAVIDILNNFLFLQYIRISTYCLNVYICLLPSFLLMVSFYITY